MRANQNSDWQTFLYFMRFLKPVWDKVLLVLLLAIILTILDINTIVLPLLSRKFLDQVLPQRDWYLFRILLIVVIGQIVLYLFFNLLSELIKYTVSLRLGIILGMKVFRYMLRLPLNFFQQRSVGEHIYRLGTLFDPGFANVAILALLFETTGSAKGESQPFVGNDVDSVLVMMTQSLDLIFRVTFRLLIILFTISISFSFQVGIALLFFCIPYIWGIHWFYNHQRRIDADYRAKSQNFLGGLQEWFAGIKTIQVFGKEKSAVLKNIALYIRLIRVEWKNYFVKLLTDNYINLFKYLFITIAILQICLSQKPTVGAVFGLYLLLEQFFSPINLYVRVIEGIRLQLIPARRLMETLNYPISIVESDDAREISKSKGKYTFQDVSFHYVPSKPVLQQISVKLPAGKKIAIVGPSGSGKSTAVNLILRFYDPVSGQIMADEIDLRDLKLRNYYQNIGIILQDDFLFGGTVRENIRFGKPDATDAEVIEAAKMAAIHDDIVKLPGGYDTDLAEGTKLSGGQRQRIALARAFIRKPAILILDEATSALDNHIAGQIENRLFEFAGEKTIITITHRLHSIINFDLILMIDQGKLVEQGTFAELINQNGLFSKLYHDLQTTQTFKV
ncbi:ABC transporter ATP-binding protein [candidate division KSB1 bacterium]|nr:ABC transporter ATP-binding protein [candidate division KSB1 bacterium]